MKKTILIIIFITISYTTFAQTKIWNNWYFGNKAGLSFNTEPPTVLTDGKINTGEGCATISDENANLLFYTDGIWVWDRNHNVMPNGTGLKGNFSTTQGALIVPYPENPNLYYLFSMGTEGDNNLYYSIIDLTKNNGNGDVDINNKNILLLSNTGEKQTAIAKTDDTGYWLVSCTSDGVFHSYSITKAGLNTTAVTSSGSNSSFGEMDFSHDGKKLAFTKIVFEVVSSDIGIQIYNFDNQTGVFSFDKSYEETYSSFTAFYGLEFSPDNSKLYTTFYQNNANSLLQFDMMSNDFVPDTVLTVNGLGGLQLAPNGKIYIANNMKSSLSCINKPNETAENCDYVLDAIDLSPGMSVFGLPNTITYPTQECPTLAGLYTIDHTQPTENRNFKSFTDAVEALKCGGISDAVTFDVANGTYNEQITIPFIEGSSATNTITFRSASGNADDVVLQSDENRQSAVLVLDTTSYLRFYDLSIKNTRIQTYSETDTTRKSIYINNSKNVKLLRNIISGIDITSTNTDNTYSSILINDCDTFEINENRIKNGTSSCWIQKSSEGVIKNNKINDFASSGIIVSALSVNVTVRSNKLETSSSQPTVYGIAIVSMSKNILTERNMINIGSTNNSLLCGIVFEFVTDNQNRVQNNMILLSTNGKVQGIRFFNSKNQTVQNNTLFVKGLNTSFHHNGLVYFVSTHDGNNILNNVFISNRNENLIGVNASSFSGAVLKFNVYYNNGGTFAISASETINSLTDWQTATNQDQNSKIYQPTFLSETDLHLAAPDENLRVNHPLTEVTDDIDGDERDAESPYAGADEPAGCNPETKTKIYHNWYFGANAAITFNTDPPTALTNSKMNTPEGSASISDNEGNLLFYTDGVTVWNKEHNVMENGNDLFGHNSSRQSAIIVPAPENPDLYYIFTTDAVENFDNRHGFCYSIADMSMNNGQEKIITKNTFVNINPKEHLAAVEHENGEDIWIVTGDYFEDKYYSYLLTTNGLNTTPVVSKFDEYFTGMLRFSPDGNTLANGGEIYDFDRKTGVVSNQLPLNYGGNYSAFSPNGRFLYLCNYYTVTQYDLTATNIPASAIQVAYDTNGEFSMAQLAPDSKIYIARGGKQYLAVINNPDEQGTACNFVTDGLYLNGKTSKQCLPTFIADLHTFYVKTSCLPEPTQFSVKSINEYQSVLWDFGDGNTSTELRPAHVYNQKGTYTVNLTITYCDNTTETISKDIEIYETPKKPKIMYSE